MNSRPYSGASDLRLMQQLLARHYAATHTRVGDVAWRARYHTHSELSLEIRLWFEAEELVAYSWLRTRGGLDLELVPHRRQDEALWNAVLDSVDATVSDRMRAGDALGEVYTWFLEQDEERMAAQLQPRGFVRSEEPGGYVLLADLSSVPEVSVPSGYSLRHVTDEDLHARVESHRAAFAPSDLTVALYRRVRATWPYRPELDRIVIGPHGEVVACATGWFDERNRAGLLEPVSTHPAYQNQGLGRLVVLDALRALRDAGASVAQVGTSGPAARAAYLAAGFLPWSREVTYRKRLDL